MKLTTKIKNRFLSSTPKIVKVLQILLTSIVSLPVYYSSLPVEFQQTIPSNILLYISLSGLVITTLLQLINKKE